MINNWLRFGLMMCAVIMAAIGFMSLGAFLAHTILFYTGGSALWMKMYGC